MFEVNQMLGWIIPVAAASMLAPACAAPVTRDAAPVDAPATAVADQTERNVTDQATPRPTVRDRYGTLDAYLAFLESRAPMDGHWYREIRPGVYRLETGNYRGPEPEQRVFTREELERKFGFSEP